MAEDIVIDKTVFFDRLSTFYNGWKADKRSGAGVFGGVGSIVILMGKTDEANAFQKANAMHVSDQTERPFQSNKILTSMCSSSGCSATNSLPLFSFLR